MDISSIMSSPVADQYQYHVEGFSYGPPPESFFTGPAARQIQNPQHIFMNYPQPAPLVRNTFPDPKVKILTGSKQRPGSAFRPFQARDGCPDIDLMALHPAPQASTPGMHSTSNYRFQAENQELNGMPHMHSLPAGAGFNGYPHPFPNAYSQPSPNVDGAAFQGMPAGQASHQGPPQLPQAYGKIVGGPSPEMLGNQSSQPFANINGAAPWETFNGHTPHGSYQSSANMTMAAPQNSFVGQSFVSTNGTAPRALQSSVDITGGASWGAQIPRQSHQLSANIASATPQESPVHQPSQSPVNIARATRRGRSVNKAAHKGSPQVPPQVPQSSLNVKEATSQGTLGSQTPHGSHQPSTNIAETGPQKSTDCQSSKPTVENTGAAHREELGSQSSQESHEAFTNRAIAALQQMLENQSPQRSSSATETTPPGMPSIQASLGSHQASTNGAVTTPQKSPVSQPSQPYVGTPGTAPQGELVSQTSQESPQLSLNTAVTAPQASPVSQPSRPVAGITQTALQGRSVGHNSLEVHRRIHGSRVNGIRKSIATQSPTTPRGHKQTQPQKSCPPPPPAQDILEQNDCTCWEADMARYLHSENVMGLYKVGDHLCDVHTASGTFVKLAERDVTSDGEHFWRHTMLGQRIHAKDTEYLNGKIVGLSNGTFFGMEDSQGNMIVPEWQFTDPVDLKSKSEEPKDQSESKEPKDQRESQGLKNLREFKKLQAALKNRATAMKKETEAVSGLKPGCDPMWF